MKLSQGAGKKGPVNLPDLSKGDSRDQVGKAIGVSGKSVDHATRVLKHGEPELIKAVDDGRMAVSTVAVKVEEILKPAAKERQKEGQKSGGRGHKKNSTQNLGESLLADKHAGEATAQAAASLNVSRGKRYQHEKRNDGGHGDQKSGGHSARPNSNTAEKIAAETNVDEKTIRRDAQFAQAVDRIAEVCGKEAKAAVLNGKAKKQDGRTAGRR
jgi:hypothetical protein